MNSYSFGNIEGNSTCTGNIRIGRIVGHNGATINNCYTTGGMNNTGTTGTRQIDFFHGLNVGTINKVYYLSKSTEEGCDYSVRNFAGTTSNMTKASFITEIGATAFKISENQDRFYPVLEWE